MTAPVFDYAGHGLVPSPSRPTIPGGGPQTVADVLARGLAQHPEREALVARSTRFTYAELDRAVDRAAHALVALGVRRFDRVAASLPNDADIVVAFLAVERIGAIWVGINRALAPPEKAYMLTDAGVVVLLADATVASQLGTKRAALSELVHLVEVRAGEERSQWATLCASAPSGPLPALEIDPFAPAAIAYTSGTTGFPKGAVHSQHNLLLPGAVAAATRAYGADVRQGVVLPLTILNLMVLVPLLAFQDGSCCVVIDRTDAEGLAEWIRREEIGHFAAVPTIYRDLLTHPAVHADALRSLRRPEVGGAECPESIQALYRGRFGAEVTIGYGMTEAPTAVARSDGHTVPRPGYCGKAVPQVEIRIATDAATSDGDATAAAFTAAGDGGDAETSERVGEVCIAPTSSGHWAGVYTPMLGYWNKPHATGEALRDGVYHSGDLGFLDDDGNLFVRGRRSELILRGGANVYPAEVERVLREHAAVADAAVLGVADDRLGQRVAAAVVLAPDARVTADELRAHCAAELARYKVPDDIRMVGTLPRNAMGKVIKRELIARFGTEDRVASAIDSARRG